MVVKYSTRKPIKWLEQCEIATGAGSVRLKRDVMRIGLKEPPKPDPLVKVQKKLKEKLTEDIPELNKVKKRFKVIGSFVIATALALNFVRICQILSQYQESSCSDVIA